MQIPPVGAELLLNTMRDQIAQLDGANPLRAQQIEAQTGQELATVEGGLAGARGGLIDVSA